MIVPFQRIMVPLRFCVLLPSGLLLCSLLLASRIPAAAALTLLLRCYTVVLWPAAANSLLSIAASGVATVPQQFVSRTHCECKCTRTLLRSCLRVNHLHSSDCPVHPPLPCSRNRIVFVKVASSLCFEIVLKCKTL